MAIPRPAIRRPLSAVIVSSTSVLGLVLSPLVVPVLVMLDLVRSEPLRRARTWCVVVGVLTVEMLSFLAAGPLWLLHIGRLDGSVAQRRFHALEHWWAGRHLANFRRFAGVRWMVENPNELAGGNSIVIGRHASHADAILPILLFGIEAGHPLRYTLKNDLLWAPAMDVVGNRLPNVFLDRAPAPGSPMTGRLEALTNDLGNHVAVIFPEGTFFTPERLDRAATRIAKTRPELEAAVRSLEHLLPPRPAGTLALMRGAPTADLVLMAHEGMEAFGDLSDIRAALPLREPVRVRVWRISRDEVPTDEDVFVAWLLDRWIDMDRWIEKRVLERRDSGGTPPSLIGAKELP